MVRSNEEPNARRLVVEPQPGVTGINVDDVPWRRLEHDGDEDAVVVQEIERELAR